MFLPVFSAERLTALNETKVRREAEAADDLRRPPLRRAPKDLAKPTLGSLLRALRSRNGWTLKEMSLRTGIPFSTLSKVENERLTLSYDKLQQLAERLGMRMSELFAEPEETGSPQVTARRSVGTVDAAVHVTTPNYDYYYLFPELRRKRMIPLFTRVRAKSANEFGDLVRHSGEEWIHVLEGRVEVHTEFYDKVCLEAGQSIYLDSSMGHAYVVGEGCEEALVIGACSSATEDQMGELMIVHSEGEESPPPVARLTRQKAVRGA
jgi:transcriptional regulator with XRE-family HTH domain